MADHVEDIGIVIRADGTVELANGMRLSGDQVSGLGKKLDEMGQAAKRAETQIGKTGQAAQTAGKDIGKAGEAITQAGREISNGNWQQVVADMARAAIEGRLLTGAMLGAGAAGAVVAAGIGAVAYAAMEGAKQQRELNNQLMLTNNFAGLLPGQLDAMSSRVAGDIKSKVSDAREVLQKFVATGKVTAEAAEEMARASMLLQRLSGQGEAANQTFMKLLASPAKVAAELNSTYHFLNLEQFKRIKQLDDEEKKQEAALVVSRAFAQHLGGDMTRNLSLLGRMVDTVARKWDGFWDAMQGLGRERSFDQLMEDSNKRLQTLGRGWMGQTPRGQADVQDERERNFRLLRRGEISRRNVDDHTAQLQADQAAIAKLMERDKTGKGSGRSLDDQLRDYLAKLEFGAENEQQGMSPTTRAYFEAMKQIETTYAKASPKLLESARQLALKRRNAAYEYEAVLARAKLGMGVEGERGDTVPAGFPNAGDRADTTTLPTGQFTRMDRVLEGGKAGKETDEAILERQKAASDASRQLRQETQRANVELIRDDQARARMQLQIEADGWRQRIDKQREGSQERKTLEEDFAAWFVARQQQLTEQAKPEWQRMVESWGDSVQMMRTFHDRAMQGVVQAGEDMFTQWARTGKLSARGLVDSIVVEFARLQYRQNIAQPLAQFASSIISAIVGGGGPTVPTESASAAIADSFASDFAAFRAPTRHTGGMAHAGGPGRNVDPRVFANAPRFHGGGIVGEEVPIIAKKREGVFTEEQMAALAPAGSGMTVHYAPTFNIDSRTDRAEVLTLVGRAVRAGQADLLEMMDRRQVR